MSNRKEYPVRFTPRGLSDAFDSTDTFPGACRSLKNLIFDQSNPELVVARPGVGLPIENLNNPNASIWGEFIWGSGYWSSGFANATSISVQIALGTIVYGMVSSNGFDLPFCYDIANQTLYPVMGYTAGNVPASQPTTGDWTPPTMAVIGPNIIVVHVGFDGITNFFGCINIANPVAPVWTAQNTSIFPLPSVPTAVANFNNRAYYACGNAAYFSDSLLPLQMTNAGQALTLGDTTPITAFSGLPIQTTSAGVVGALIVFKEFSIWQITGDEAITGSLAENFLSLQVGCIAPRTVVLTPVGTIFAGIDGPFYVSPLGQVLPLTKDFNKLVQDLQKPFQNIVTPSRAAAAFTGSIYRICMITRINGATVTNDYWFDVTVRRWNGPHSFAYDCASQVGDYFILSYAGMGALLFKSPYLPELDSVYNDNGVPLSVYLETSMFPKTQNINMKQVIESTIELSTASSALTYHINAIDDYNNQIGSADVTVVSPLPVWGGFNWGDGTLWSSAYLQPLTYYIPWTSPLVFKKMALQISAQSSYNLAIGTSFSKYIDCGYTNTIGLWRLNPAPLPTIPSPPQNLVAIGGVEENTMTWDAVFNASSYNLYWSLVSGSGITGTEIVGVSSPYVQTGLTPGVPYYYVVTAVNGIGESGPSNQATATPTAPPDGTFSVFAVPGSVGNVVMNQYLYAGDVVNIVSPLPYNEQFGMLATGNSSVGLFTGSVGTKKYLFTYATLAVSPSSASFTFYGQGGAAAGNATVGIYASGSGAGPTSQKYTYSTDSAAGSTNFSSTSSNGGGAAGNATVGIFTGLASSSTEKYTYGTDVVASGTSLGSTSSQEAPASANATSMIVNVGGIFAKKYTFSTDVVSSATNFASSMSGYSAAGNGVEGVFAAASTSQTSIYTYAGDVVTVGSVLTAIPDVTGCAASNGIAGVTL